MSYPIPSAALDDRLAIVGTCKVCGADIGGKRRHIQQFCSRKCQGIAKRTLPLPTERSCGTCGRIFVNHPKRPDQRFCSRRCGSIRVRDKDYNATIARRSANKRGQLQRGKGDGRSYRKLMGKHEHRAVAELTIGRPLVAGEIVHHIDGNKENNSPDNLQVLPSQSVHARIHFKGSKQRPDHVARRVSSTRLTKNGKEHRA